MTTETKINTTENLNTLYTREILTQAFKRAVWNGFAETAEFLLDHGVEIPQEPDIWRGGRYNPLKLAAHRGHYALAKKLLDRGCGEEWSRGATVLAVCSGNTDLLKLFLDRGLASERELEQASSAAKAHGYADCLVLLDVALQKIRQEADIGGSAPAPAP